MNGENMLSELQPCGCVMALLLLSARSLSLMAALVFVIRLMKMDGRNENGWSVVSISSQSGHMSPNGN